MQCRLSWQGGRTSAVAGCWGSASCGFAEWLRLSQALLGIAAVVAASGKDRFALRGRGGLTALAEQPLGLWPRPLVGLRRGPRAVPSALAFFEEKLPTEVP